MDISGVSGQNSAVELGNLLKSITAEKNGLSDKLITANVEQKVQNEKLGNMIDVVA
jgi:hypothetical protein